MCYHFFKTVSSTYLAVKTVYVSHGLEVNCWVGVRYISQHWPLKSLSISLKPAELLREGQEYWQKRKGDERAGIQQKSQTLPVSKTRNPRNGLGSEYESVRSLKAKSRWCGQMWRLYSLSGRREATKTWLQPPFMLSGSSELAHFSQTAQCIPLRKAQSSPHRHHWHTLPSKRGEQINWTLSMTLNSCESNQKQRQV